MSRLELHDTEMATKKEQRALTVKSSMEHKSAAASARKQTVMLSVTLVLMKMKTLIMFIVIEGRLKVRMRRLSVPLRYKERLSFIIPVSEVNDRVSPTVSFMILLLS
ncbi:hypothetical protein PoB_005660400 [Plakobranchus ocellatus]|uniref:Uncharacterized protein n=1 Tax=Plakobranchus ocellatus TaxID=259542 RepID=A0AAV4CG05_9GAST|nr:hypothetical protein PoB_005660400 [Plakobranchus ocellatus]